MESNKYGNVLLIHVHTYTCAPIKFRYIYIYYNQINCDDENSWFYNNQFSSYNSYRIDIQQNISI